jgi:AraC family transcriptional regulator
MATKFKHLRAHYYDADPARAERLRGYHVREQEIAGLIATETQHPPQFRIPKHSHELASFYVVLDGSLTEITRGREHDLSTCSVVFTPAGEIHSNAFHGAGGRCFLVELAPQWSERLAAFNVQLERGLAADTGDLTRLGLRLYNEFHSIDDAAPLAVEGLTLEILAGFARGHFDTRASHPPAWLRTVKELVHDRFAGRITLDEIAAQVGVRPFRVARAFRKHYRCSVAEYQRRLRVENGARLLATTARPLADIGLAAGFADQAHFSRTFKAHIGLTPTQFRAAHTVRSGDSKGVSSVQDETGSSL